MAVENNEAIREGVTEEQRGEALHDAKLKLLDTEKKLHDAEQRMLEARQRLQETEQKFIETRQKARETVAKNLFKIGMSHKEIAKATGLSEAELSRLSQKIIK